MFRAIGGSFGISEIDCEPYSKSNLKTHLGNCMFFKSGSTAIEHISNSIKNMETKVFLPEYNCIEIVGAFRGRKTKFYQNDNQTLRPITDSIHDGIVFIIDYFGVEQLTIKELDKIRNNNNIIILDVTHSILNKNRLETNNYIQIGSLHKTFQVPPSGIIRNYNYNLYNNDKYDTIYNYINIEKIIQKRWTNLKELYELFKDTELLMYKLNEIQSPFTCPIVFKDQTERDHMKQRLIKQMIYPPIHWECNHPISKKILSIPIDQRYNTTDMRRIYEVLLS